MLVLSRREQETIMIGTTICLKIVRVQGNQVRIAIEAPPDVKILRGEFENQSTARSLRVNAAADNTV
jgi:carbon storage regulator